MKAVVFTKPPVPGTVKTRLIPALGPEGAAQLHTAMAADVFELVRTAGLELTVSLAGDPDHPWARSLDCPVEPQVSGDLGARMAHALRGGDCLALGTDAPTLPIEVLRRAARLESEVVVGPAFDGGYWCIGWSPPRPELLADIAWSTSSVLAETMLHARRHEIDVTLLPFWYDVDTPDVLDLLVQQLRFLPSSVAPRTRACLSTHKASRPS
ncbi:MAG: glycosyltransferase [Proteobacteria bacterium]|nr:glycosyltransferase [Pseudomonadota bacterium]